LLAGELVLSPRPAFQHARAASVLGMDLGSPFQRGRGGPGGWWILDEPELHVGPHVLVPDLAGWRRERMPELPDVPYFTLAPEGDCPRRAAAAPLALADALTPSPIRSSPPPRRL
jgi:hypothetical protein